MDFNKPAIGDNYATGYTAAITANQVDLGKLLDSSSVTVSNPVAGVKRYNATNDLFEQRNAGNTAWEEMPLAYLKLAGGTLTGSLVGTSGNFTSALQMNGNAVWHAGNFSPSSKQDALGYTPVNKAGDTMTGTHNFATLQVGGQGVWHAGNFSPSGYAALTGATFTGDITTYRSGAPTTGVLYLGSSGLRYLYYDGSQYVLANAALAVGGTVYAGGGFQNTSARAAKRGIEPVKAGALARVMQWGVIEYEYRACPGRRRIGLVADDTDGRISTGRALDLDSALFELAAAVQELARARQ